MGTRSASSVSVCFFDLDDTLYPKSTGIASHCSNLIREYMVSHLGFNPDTVDAGNAALYRKHGTSMAGLRAEGYSFSFDDPHNHVHVPLPYNAIRPDPELRNVLHNLPQRKYVFTNSDRGHASRCLSRLGVEDCIHGVIAFEDIMEAPPQRPHSERNSVPSASGDEWDGDAALSSSGDVVASWRSETGPLVCCKPQVEAFMRALKLAGATAEQTMMFDDSASNLAGAKKAGLHTVLVGSTNHTLEADFCIASLHNLRAAVPELWEGQETVPTKCSCEGQVSLQAVNA